MILNETVNEALPVQGEAPSRIRSLARFAQIFSILGMAVILWYTAETAYLMSFDTAAYDQMLTFAYSVLSASPEFVAVFEAGLPKYDVPESYSPSARLIVLLSTHLTNLLGFFALFGAWELFRGYGRGEIFTEAAAMRFSRIGWMITLLAPIGFVGDYGFLKTIVVAAAPGEAIWTFGAVDWELAVFINVGELDVFAIVIGLLIVLVGRILSEASKISDENRSFI